MTKREAKIRALEWAARSLNTDAMNVFAQCRDVDLKDWSIKLYAALVNLSEDLKNKAERLRADKAEAPK